jgi:hypothetical protein
VFYHSFWGFFDNCEKNMSWDGAKALWGGGEKGELDHR